MYINEKSSKFLGSIEWMTWDGSTKVSILMEKVPVFP